MCEGVSLCVCVGVSVPVGSTVGNRRLGWVGGGVGEERRAR